MTDTFPYLPLGPLAPEQDGTRRFRIWAPLPDQIELLLLNEEGSDRYPMREETDGYLISDPVVAPAGTRYGYYLNGKDDKLYPDPASRYQPEGVHGPSEVIDLPAAAMTGWKGRSLEESVIYELHIGTFTEAGTFAAAEERLDYLRDLGVTVLEIMPLNQTSGERNWGYDGVLPSALFQAYGRPEDFHRFVRSAHDRGIAVLVDVIYNHLGPEGNYLPEFFPVFTEKHHTPWGSAINFDDAHADGVRNYWLENVRLWLEVYGADGLRIDAVHAIKDYSASHFLEEVSALADRIGEAQGRQIITIAECDLNAPRYLQSRERGGYGMSAQWVDEFHHALHGLLTGEVDGYYEDFGRVEQLSKALRDGYVYTGQYSHHRKRNFGRQPGADITPAQMVVFLQNHDQVGNRMEGDRLLTGVGTDKYLLGAATYLLSPFTPLIFMGEEYGEERPFPYFVHHGDDWLIKAVREGRAKEFAAFQKEGHEVPDPQSEQTYRSAKLSWSENDRIARFYREALHLRAAAPRAASFEDISVDRSGSLITWNTRNGNFTACGNYGDEPLTIEVDSNELLLASNGATLEDNQLQLPAWGFAAIA